MTTPDPLDGRIRESLSKLVARAPQPPDFEDLSPAPASGRRPGPLLMSAAVALIVLAIGGLLLSRSGDSAVTSGAADGGSGVTNSAEAARSVGSMSPDEFAAAVATAAAPTHDLVIVSAIEREMDGARPDAGTFIEVQFAVEGGTVRAFRQRFDERPPDEDLASGNDYKVEQLADGSELITISPAELARAQAVHFRADGVMVNLIATGDDPGGVAPMTAQALGEVLRALQLVDPSVPPTAETATPDERECTSDPRSVTDLGSEPDWRRHADYRPWTDARGCFVRIDVLAERSGPDHCGWEDADVLIVGTPLGEPYTSANDSVTYVRDPDAVFGDPDLAAGYEADANVPAEAVDSGFRREGLSLWHVPGDQSAVWVVEGDTAERWPRGEPPLCR